MGICPEGGREVARRGTFLGECIERLRRVPFNTDGTLVEVVDVPTVFMRDPFLCLKKAKKGPHVDHREKVQPIEVEKGTRSRLLSSEGSGGQSILERRNKPTPRLRLLPRGRRYMLLAHTYSFLVLLLRLAKTFCWLLKAREGSNALAPEVGVLLEDSNTPALEANTPVIGTETSF